MSDDGNDDSSCDVVSVVECIVAPVGLASHGGIINFSGVNIAPSDCVCATQHERCLSPLNDYRTHIHYSRDRVKIIPKTAHYIL